MFDLIFFTSLVCVNVYMVCMCMSSHVYAGTCVCFVHACGGLSISTEPIVGQPDNSDNSPASTFQVLEV